MLLLSEWVIQLRNIKILAGHPLRGWRARLRGHKGSGLWKVWTVPSPPLPSPPLPCPPLPCPALPSPSPPLLSSPLPSPPLPSPPLPSPPLPSPPLPSPPLPSPPLPSPPLPSPPLPSPALHTCHVVQIRHRKVNYFHWIGLTFHKHDQTGEWQKWHKITK